MLAALKFVKGAVSTKDYVPALTHFRISGHRVTGYNGKLSLSSPIPLDIECCPKAVPFVKAIEACEDVAQLALAQNGKLSVRSGKFRATIETLADEYPEVLPEGERVAIDGALLPALRLLYAFTSDDASRPWAAGILLDGNSAFATNNVVLCECWLGYHFPFMVNLPRTAVRELLRIGEEPVSLMLSGNSATFFFDGDRWMRTQLNSHVWPDAGHLLNNSTGHACPIPEGFFEAVAKVAPFCADAGLVHFVDGCVSTGIDTTDATSVHVDGLAESGAYNAKMLSLLDGVATSVAFGSYPKPCLFYGDRLRGLLMGARP